MPRVVKDSLLRKGTLHSYRAVRETHVYVKASSATDDRSNKLPTTTRPIRTRYS